MLKHRCMHFILKKITLSRFTPMVHRVYSKDNMKEETSTNKSSNKYNAQICYGYIRYVWVIF